MRQKSLLLLAAAAATASAQTRITNWEEQHQRFVRQAAFEDLLSWFRAISASRGAAAVSRHRRASSPGEQAVGGLFFDFEAVRTESRDHDAPKAVVGDLLLALRGDEVLFVREVDGPADVTVVAS
jgi:hypothetical protein